MINLLIYIQLVIFLFTIGLCGVFLNRKNIIIILMSIELMLLSINLHFIVCSINLDDLIGQLFTIYVLTIAAAESAIGLAILIIYYRIRGSLSISYINIMKD